MPAKASGQVGMTLGRRAPFPIQEKRATTTWVHHPDPLHTARKVRLRRGDVESRERKPNRESGE